MLRARVDNAEYTNALSCSFDQEVEAEEDDGLRWLAMLHAILHVAAACILACST